MNRKTTIAFALTCVPVVLSGFSSAATVVIQTALSGSGAAPTMGLVPISTGAIRSSGTAPAANSAVQGRMSPEVSGTPSSTSREEGPTSGRQSATRDEGPTSGRQSAGGKRAPGASKTARAAGAAPSSKDAIAPEIVYDDPGAFHFTAEAGYSSKHIWRGIDVAQFTSDNYVFRRYNNLDGSSLTTNPDSDVTYVGANVAYQGFLFGLKYIETLDDTFNPFFSESYSDKDSYSELVLTMNYSRMLVGTDMLEGTFGFDFYYYPNGEFWGVDHQGMLYARLSSPHYKWAQPFLEVFYNIATDTNGNGLAADPVNLRGASGSQLVEGGGCEIGVKGGDSVYSNDTLSLALTYSISTFYKTGYQFEPDGFSHLSLTVGAPLSIGANFTITPSVSYVAALQDIDNNYANMGPGIGVVNFGGANAKAWNEPGWVAGVKASYRF